MYERKTRGRRELRLASIATALLAVYVMTVNPAMGQTANAQVTGLIKDQSGAGVPGVLVTVTSVATSEKKSMTTDPAGRYTIIDLDPGFYEVRAEKSGFATTVIPKQEFLVGTTATEDFNLRPAAAGDQRVVEVVKDTSIIESTQAEVSTVLVTRSVDSLPTIDRNAGSLSTQAPGAQYSGSGTSATIQIGHSAAYQTGYILDLMPNQTGNQGSPYFALAQDWVQSFRVEGLQYPAEFGNASGGVIVTSTHSGGNQIHGRLYGFYQNADLNSNPSYYTGATKAPFSSTRLGAAVGGPIKKDKLFFYAGFDELHSTTTSVLNATALAGAFGTTAQPVGTPASQLVPWLAYGNITTLPSLSVVQLAMLKLDYTPTAKDRFFLRGNLDFETTKNSGFGTKNTYGLSSGKFADPYGAVMGWTRTISPNAVNDFRLGYFQNGHITNTYDIYCNIAPVYPGSAINQNPYSYTTTQSIGGPSIWGNPDGYYTDVTYNTTSTGSGSGRDCGAVNNANGNLTAQDSVTRIRGSHEIKFGGFYRYEDQWARNNQNNSAGTYTFASSAGPMNPNTAILQNFTAAGFTAAEKLAPLSYTVLFNGTPGLGNYRFRYSSGGGFIQDSWKIRSNLTLNYGIRYDISNNNSELAKEKYPALEAAVPGSVGFIQPGFRPPNNDPLDIAPRFGFAWTPFRDHDHTLIRGGFGIFYNANDGAVVSTYISGNAWGTYDYTISANTATTNPYCIGGVTCAGGIPAQYEIAAQEVLQSALTNFTLPQFPLSTAPCAKTNTCTVAVGPNVYNIPALSTPYQPQGGRVDISPTYRVPAAAQTTIGIQHQFGNWLTASVDYVNHLGFDGVVTINNNIGLTGPGASQTYTFINPAYTAGFEYETIGTLKANDLQVRALFHDHRNDRISLAYQYGHSTDNSVSNFAISAHNAYVSNPFNLNYDLGPSTTDIRHNLVMNANIPMYWGVELSPIFTVATGIPYSATSSIQTPGSALAPAGCLAYFAACYPAGYSRDSLRGANTYGLNARMSKRLRFSEHQSLLVLFEAFNIPSWRNRGTAYFANVDTTTGASAFGQPTNASTTLRQVQVGARFDF